jgi:putative sterol carrier protein
MTPFETVADALQAVVVGADASKLAGIDKVVMFDLAGEGGGQWTATIADGKVELVEGAATPPNTTFKMKADVFLGIVNGKINPVAAFMQGKVRVQGDMSVAMRLQSFFM